MGRWGGDGPKTGPFIHYDITTYTRPSYTSIQSTGLQEQEKIKLLLLGAGESGKSTIFKQMKLLYGAGTTLEDRKMMTPVVYSNTIGAMRVLLEQSKKFGFEEEIGDKAAVEAVEACAADADIDVALGTALKTLWQDAGACRVCLAVGG